MQRNICLALVLMSLCSLYVVNCHKYQSPYEVIKMNQLTFPQTQSNAFISASPELLENSGDWVIVKFGGISDPNENDWIGVFSPANVDITKTSPVKYQFASYSPSFMQNGYGALNFSLVNMHSDVAFVLLRNGLSSPVFAAKSNSVSFKNMNEPLQGHIALTGIDNEIRVMWATGYNAGTQSVKYGLQSNSYPYSSDATTDTYDAVDLCGAPANSYGWKLPGLLHETVLQNLVPGQKYYYRYGNDDITGWSEELTFVAPLPPAVSQEISVFAFGDMGKAEVDSSIEHWEEVPSLQTTRHMIELRDELDLVLHIGDIAYAVGYSAQWDRFMEQIKPIASHVPYMTCPGNHERDFPNSGSFFTGTDSGGECGVPYEKRFRMPVPGKDKLWYSFNLGPVHFILMSTEHNFTTDSEQFQWIQWDLKHVDKKKTPWIIFSGHRPMYIDSNNTTPNGGDQPVATLLRESLEDLFVQYGVDLAFWGHHHSYQRSCPVYRGTCQSKRFPVHVVIGMAGMGLSTNLETQTPSWARYVDDQEYGYSRFWANSTTIHMQYYGNESGLKDEFYLHK